MVIPIRSLEPIHVRRNVWAGDGRSCSVPEEMVSVNISKWQAIQRLLNCFKEFFSEHVLFLVVVKWYAN
jgi:hypothetical protein